MNVFWGTVLSTEPSAMGIRTQRNDGKLRIRIDRFIESPPLEAFVQTVKPVLKR
jgi:hypothetical protein